MPRHIIPRRRKAKAAHAPDLLRARRITRNEDKSISHSMKLLAKAMQTVVDGEGWNPAFGKMGLRVLLHRFYNLLLRVYVPVYTELVGLSYNELYTPEDFLKTKAKRDNIPLTARNMRRIKEKYISNMGELAQFLIQYFVRDPLVGRVVSLFPPFLAIIRDSDPNYPPVMDDIEKVYQDKALSEADLWDATGNKLVSLLYNIINSTRSSFDSAIYGLVIRNEDETDIEED